MSWKRSQWYTSNFVQMLHVKWPATLKPLTSEVSNDDHPVTVRCAGKLWVLGLTWDDPADQVQSPLQRGSAILKGRTTSQPIKTIQERLEEHVKERSALTWLPNSPEPKPLEHSWDVPDPSHSSKPKGSTVSDPLPGTKDPLRGPLPISRQVRDVLVDW